jgi:hypothetical protein
VNLKLKNLGTISGENLHPYNRIKWWSNESMVESELPETGMLVYLMMMLE